MTAQPFNRTSFLTLNQTRLFTAEQVANLVEQYQKGEKGRMLNQIELLESFVISLVDNQNVLLLSKIQDRIGEIDTSLRSQQPEQVDLLDVLEKWSSIHTFNDRGGGAEVIDIDDLDNIIQKLHTNPAAVIERGRSEGWLK